MMRTLLATTALAAVLTTSAIAQTNSATGTMPKTATETQNLATTQQQTMVQEGYVVYTEGQILANSLIGKTIYNGSGDNAEAIGDVNDLVISADGTTEAVIVGVGGFLGIGERDVAVSFDRLTWVDRDGDRWIVVESTREQLENAPAFDRTALIAPTNNTGADNTVQTGGTMPATSGEQNTADNQVIRKSQENLSSTDEQPADSDVAANQNNSATTESAPRNTAENTTGENNATPMDRSTLETVDIAQMKGTELIGTRVYGAGDADIGEVSDVIITDSGSVEAFIVDVGGFIGVGEKAVAISSENLDFMRDGDGEMMVFTPFSAEVLESRPAYDEQAYQADRENGVLRAPRT